MSKKKVKVTKQELNNDLVQDINGEAIQEKPLTEKQLAKLVAKRIKEEAKQAKLEAKEEAKKLKEEKKRENAKLKQKEKEEKEYSGMSEEIIEGIKALKESHDFEYALSERLSFNLKIKTGIELDDRQLMMIREYSNAIFFDASRRRDLLLPIHNKKVQIFAGKFLNLAVIVFESSMPSEEIEA